MVAAEFIDNLRGRLRQFFVDQADGLDIPPGQLYHLEGRMASALDLQLLSEAELRALLVALCRELLGEAAAAVYERDDRVMLHLQMRPAPVYPSTRDD